ncbi:hypothetical protein CASFOL_022653 [Castilleja foliolosa]|uniref:Uncharacterized protein n=1 Tax=Castilleja foliolosa TaxID=1961234 RepID=A0ABD3CV43_9LAMI
MSQQPQKRTWMVREDPEGQVIAVVHLRTESRGILLSSFAIDET